MKIRDDCFRQCMSIRSELLFWVIRMQHAALVTQNKRIIYSATNVNRYVNPFKGFEGLRDEDLASDFALANDVHTSRQRTDCGLDVTCANYQITSDIIYIGLCCVGRGNIHCGGGRTDGEVARYVGDDESSNRCVVFRFSPRDSHLCRVRTVSTGEVGDEALGEGMEVTW